jgi:hypothetical protein
LIEPLLECSQSVEGRQGLHLVPHREDGELPTTVQGDFSLRRVSSERFPL